MIKRITTLVFVFLTIVGNAVWGQGTSWTGQGTGTPENPYQISNADDLKAFRNLVNGGKADACAILIDNIDLENEEWTPIYYCSEEGITATLSYTGTFDGNNKTIKGLNISKDNYASALFGAIGVIEMNFSGSMETKSIGEVKDLTVEGSFNKDLTTTAGGICGYNAGTIRNCVSNITTSDFNRATIGGICAYNLGTITKCINKGNIKTSSGAGGICGKNGGEGIIEQCYNEGSIQGKGMEAVNVGGICGNAEYGNPVIKNCYNVGELTSERSVSGICCIPSLNTSYETHATITNCHNYGTITPTEGAYQAGICTVSQQPNVTVSISNNYYLESVAEAGLVYTTYLDETPNDQPGQTEAKNIDEFANGEVLALLQNNNPGVWTQGEKYPVFVAEGEIPTTVYTITFDYNYEGSEPDYQYALEGSSKTVEFPEAPTCEDYTFLGWSETQDGGIIDTSTPISITGDKTYYAQWQSSETEEPGDENEDQDNDKPGTIVKPIKYYNIYIDTICPGLDVEVSKDVVQEGHQVSAYLTIQAECDTTSMRFEYKRGLFGYWQDLKALEGVQPGEYIIKNIYTDIYIRALDATLPEEEPTGIEDVEGVKAYVKDGSIYIYTPNREQVTIISMSGAIIKHAEQIGMQSYSVSRGIYIVRIGEKVFKLKN